MKVTLSNVTIISVDCQNYGAAVGALQKSLEEVTPARAVLLTDIPLEIDGIEIIQIPTISSKEQYSEFIIKKLNDYFDTEFVMVVQHDGYIISGESWNDEFYEYDFLGAPWLYVDNKNVGCGGASLRSKKLQKALAEDPFIKATDPEDQAIGRLYRDYLIKEHGIKFPSQELAETFAFELREPTCKTFAFHGHFYEPFKETIILSRSAAIGDIILLEPVMRWFSLHGYNVVLDIPIQFFDLFSEHYFPVKHISQFDRRRIPAREINLDKSYEVRPGQPYLKSYFEFCGIKDFELTKPFLYPIVSKETKLFRKLAIIHIDVREQEHRNAHGVKWSNVVDHLEQQGYVVLQVGRYRHESVAPEINTSSIRFLKFVISSCDIFIGVDSSPAHIAVAYNKACVIMCGSVNPELVYPDLTNVEIIQQPCDHAFCWHTKSGSSEGVPCFYVGTEKEVQCSNYNSKMIIDAIDKFILK